VEAGWPATVQKIACTAGSRWSTNLKPLMTSYHVPKHSYHHRTRGTVMSTCPVAGRWKLYARFRCLQNHQRPIFCPIQLWLPHLYTITSHRPLEQQWKKKRVMMKNILSSGLQKARHSFSTSLLKYPLLNQIYLWNFCIYQYWQLQYFSFILEQAWLNRLAMYM